jgi:signal transduction histidine kinase
MISQNRAKTVFFAAVALLVFSGIFGTYTLLRLRASQRWVSHSRDVEKALAEVNFAGTRASQFRASYVDSGRPEDLEAFRASTSQMLRASDDMKRLIVDNPNQQANWRKLSDAIQHRIETMNRAITLKDSGQSTLERQASVNRELVNALAASNEIVERMAREEQLLLEERLQRSQRSFLLTSVVLSFAFLAALALFFLYSQLLNAELQARQRAESSLRTLTARLLQIQDEERRKFSRELHDSIGQYLAGIKMNLALLTKNVPDNEALAEANDLIDKAGVETRTISYLLHPPMLDEAGLTSAVKWYVDGFARRSGVQIQMDFPSDLGRLPTSVEIALFRVMQEALTNIHRHAQTTRAQIALTRSGDRVNLRIRDFGRGIPRRTLERFRSSSGPTGVGLAGMRERIAELGGQLEIDSDSHGTQILVTLPLGNPTSQTALASD